MVVMNNVRIHTRRDEFDVTEVDVSVAAVANSRRLAEGKVVEVEGAEVEVAEVDGTSFSCSQKAKQIHFTYLNIP